jgi:alanyl aminopeptidase
MAQTWLKDRSAVSPELTGRVLSIAARHGGRDFYDQLLAAAKQTRNRRERGYIIDAIGSFRDPDVARAALGLMLSGEIDIRELTGLLADFQNDPATERIPWEFVTANYDKLLPRLPSQLGTHAGSILPGAGASFCDAAGYSAVEKFFKERIKPVSGGARTLAKTLEAIQLCQPLRSTQGPELDRYLKGL